MWFYHIIGLTGSISSGKSTVSSHLIENNYVVVDCDEIARFVVQPGKPAYQKIVQVFGKEVLLENKELDRTKLASIIFSQPEKRKILNGITHRYILFEMGKRLLVNFWRGERVVFLDAPLLYEVGLQRICSKVMVIYADEEKQLARLVKRDSISQEEALKKINSQMKLSEKCRRADIVIDNNGTIPETKKQVNDALSKLQKQYTNGLTQQQASKSLAGKFIISSICLSFLFGMTFSCIRILHLLRLA